MKSWRNRGCPRCSTWSGSRSEASNVRRKTSGVFPKTFGVLESVRCATRCVGARSGAGHGWSGGSRSWNLAISCGRIDGWRLRCWRSARTVHGPSQARGPAPKIGKHAALSTENSARNRCWLVEKRPAHHALRTAARKAAARVRRDFRETRGEKKVCSSDGKRGWRRTNAHALPTLGKQLSVAPQVPQGQNVARGAGGGVWLGLTRVSAMLASAPLYEKGCRQP